MFIQSSIMMPPRQVKNVVRLADHGGDYVLLLKCACGHTRRTGPHLLAHVFGWQALLSEVTKKLRCSSCNERKCTVSIFPATKRDYR